MIDLRPLSGDSDDDMDRLRRVIERAQDYTHLATGAPPGPADASNLCTILPDGKGHDDKFVFGVFDGTELCGCLDVIRGYPDASTAHLGLLLIAADRRGRGLGRAACAALEDVVRSWPDCARLRLGVLRHNVRAHGFWLRLGYRPTGEVKPYRDGPVTSETVIYTKPSKTDGPAGGAPVANDFR